MADLYFEDFHVGQELPGGSTHTMDADDIIRFSKLYDPQPQHVDATAAKDTQFGELVASGWHTGGVSMRMKLDGLLGNVVGGLAGLGLDEVRWPRPVKPGDTLRIVTTIIEMRPSQSKLGKGIVRYKVKTFNQRDELVMEIVTSALMNRRPA